MKLELLVIGYHNDPVNLEPGLVHTARHAKKVRCALHIRYFFFIIYLFLIIIFIITIII